MGYICSYDAIDMKNFILLKKKNPLVFGFLQTQFGVVKAVIIDKYVCYVGFLSDKKKKNREIFSMKHNLIMKLF